MRGRGAFTLSILDPMFIKMLTELKIKLESASFLLFLLNF